MCSARGLNVKHVWLSDDGAAKMATTNTKKERLHKQMMRKQEERVGQVFTIQRKGNDLANPTPTEESTLTIPNRKIRTHTISGTIS